MLKHNLRRISLSFLLMICTLISFAQTEQGSFDATMRSNDKIYVVMAVCLIILIAVFLYLIRIDIKVSKKEKNH